MTLSQINIGDEAAGESMKHPSTGADVTKIGDVYTFIENGKTIIGITLIERGRLAGIEFMMTGLVPNRVELRRGIESYLNGVGR